MGFKRSFGMRVVCAIVRIVPLPALILSALAIPPEAVGQLAVSGAVGINFAGAAVTSGQARDFESVTGTAFGLGVIFGAEKVLGVHLGTAYSPRGATWLDGGERFTVDVDYFEIAALARARASLGGSTFGLLLVGPTLGVRGRCRLKVAQADLSISSPCSGLFPGATVAMGRESDIALSLGGGVETEVGERLGAFLSLVFSIGLVDVLAESGWRHFDGGPYTAKHRVASLQAGVAYRVR